MAIRKKDELMDALLLGNVDWEKARKAAYKMASQLTSEVANLDNLKDAYSPMAWINGSEQESGKCFVWQPFLNSWSSRYTRLDEGKRLDYGTWLAWIQSIPA